MINEKGLSLIKEFEGLFLHPYRDPVGIPTIGYGTIRYKNGQHVTLNDNSITEKEASELLEYEVNEKAAKVDEFLNREEIALNENEFAALVCFAYNLGPGPVIISGRTMCEALKSNDKDRIADAFLIYNKAQATVNGSKVMKELPGLTRRRKAERALFLTPIDEVIT